MAKILVQTQVDSKVYTDFSRFHNFIHGHRAFSLGAFPLLMIGFAIMNGLTGSWFLFGLFVVLGILMPVGYLVFYRRGVSNQIRLFGLEQNILVYSVLLDDAGLHVDMGEDLFDYTWEALYGAYKVPPYIYLYVTKIQCFILTNENVEKGKDAGDVWNMILSHMGKYRTKSYGKQ